MCGVWTQKGAQCVRGDAGSLLWLLRWKPEDEDGDAGQGMMGTGLWGWGLGRGRGWGLSCAVYMHVSKNLSASLVCVQASMLKISASLCCTLIACFCNQAHPYGAFLGHASPQTLCVSSSLKYLLIDKSIWCTFPESFCRWEMPPPPTLTKWRNFVMTISMLSGV